MIPPLRNLKPKICLGMTLHNAARFLPEAIESLLNQTYEDFTLLAFDDASTDETGSIVKNYARQDSRIKYHRNPRNLGMIDNHRLAFKTAQRTVKGLDYFGWAGDHDIWLPDWLRAHVETLNENPNVVLTYPLAVPIGIDGEELSATFPKFDNSGMNKSERIRAACLKMKGAGNMVYGLYRAEALAKTSVFPRCMHSDLVLMLQLSVHGTFKNIETPLWRRRYVDNNPSGSDGPVLSYEQWSDRQRPRVFNGNPPWYSHFPFLSHAWILIFSLSIRPRGGDYVNLHWGLLMACLHLSRRREHLRQDLRIVVKKVLSKLKLISYQLPR